ncbi:hypothetical protein N9L26_01930 [Candidatus Pacebacteria bacterium]|nr:hypothetical protein [Candidatus Paceibacterota bacterium]
MSENNVRTVRVSRVASWAIILVTLAVSAYLSLYVITQYNEQTNSVTEQLQQMIEYRTSERLAGSEFAANLPTLFTWV